MGRWSAGVLFSWVLLGLILLSIIIYIYLFNILWGLIGLLGLTLILIPIMATGDFDLRWELMLLLLAPLLLGLSGASDRLGGWLHGIDVSLVMVVPVLGLILIVDLQRYTTLRSNASFAVFFVAVFTLAVGGFISIGEYVSDRFLGTNLIEDNVNLMVDLTYIFIGGVLIGFFSRWYRDWSIDQNIQGTHSQPKARAQRQISIISFLLHEGFGDVGRSWAPIISRVLQALIVLVFVVGLYIGEIGWAVSAFISFWVTLIPSILGRSLRIFMPPLLNLWIVVVLFLHVSGGLLGFYDYLWWWDHLTHILFSILVATLGFIALLAIDLHSETLHIPDRFVPLFILMFVMATGVFWEILEFVIDQVFGSNMQYSLIDTILDMVFNLLGGLVAAVFGYFYFEPLTRLFARMNNKDSCLDQERA